MSVGVFEWARSVVAIAKEGEATGIPTIEESDLSELAAAKWILERDDRWVPLAERRPANGSVVLALEDYGDGHHGMIHLAQIREMRFEQFYGDEPIDNVTHWYAFPAPPREDE